MKRIFTALLILSVFSRLQGQTITQANHPTAGEIWIEYVDTVASAIPPMTAPGPGQTWDYSTSFNVNDTSGIDFKNMWEAPAYMNGSTTFPNSTMVSFSVTDSAGLFYKSLPSGLYWDGFYQPGIINEPTVNLYADYVDFAPDRMVIPSPISLNGVVNHTSQFYIDYVYSGFNVHQSMSFVQHFEADATGNLVTPMGSFNNVLRVKETTYSVDSMTTNNPLIPPQVNIHDTTITYYFLQASSHMLLMEVMVNPNSLQPISAGYYDPIFFVGMNKNDNIKVSMYPNPATESFYLSHIRNNSTIQIFDITGKLIKEQGLNLGDDSTININTTDMNAGCYFINIFNENGGNYYKGKFEVIR